MLLLWFSAGFALAETTVNYSEKALSSVPFEVSRQFQLITGVKWNEATWESKNYFYNEWTQHKTQQIKKYHDAQVIIQNDKKQYELEKENKKKERLARKERLEKEKVQQEKEKRRKQKEIQRKIKEQRKKMEQLRKDAERRRKDIERKKKELQKAKERSRKEYLRRLKSRK